MKEKRKITRLYCLLVFLIFFIFIGETSVSADGSGANFGITITEYPKQQVDTKDEPTYFDLKVKPKDKIKVKVKVTNFTKEKIKINAQLNRALTTNTGAITYELSEAKDTYKIKDNRNFYKMTSLDKPKITLKGAETKEITASIDVPEEEFDGMILGGIYFKQEINEKELEKQQILNTFAYSVPIRIVESEKKQKPKITVDDVYPTLRNKYPFIEVVLKNKTADLINNLEVEGSIFKENGDEALYFSKKEKLQMAPMSDLDFGFDMNGTEVEEGQYLLKMKIKADGNKEEFTKKFEIEKDEAQKINDASVVMPKKEKNIVLYVLIVVFSMLLIGGVIWFVYYKNNKNKKKTKRKNKISSKKKKS